MGFTITHGIILAELYESTATKAWLKKRRKGEEVPREIRKIGKISKIEWHDRISSRETRKGEYKLRSLKVILYFGHFELVSIVKYVVFFSFQSSGPGLSRNESDGDLYVDVISKFIAGN